MGSILHPLVYNLRLKNPHFLPDFYLWDGFPQGFFWAIIEVFDVPLTGVFDVSLTGVLEFSLSGDLSFLLVYFTGNLRFSFTGFIGIEDPHLLDVPLLLWGRFSGLVSILDVCSEVRHSLSILLLVRSNNLGNFLDLGGFANSSASCFLFKDAISDSYTSAFSSFRYWTACPLLIYFLE